MQWDWSISRMEDARQLAKKKKHVPTKYLLQQYKLYTMFEEHCTSAWQNYDCQCMYGHVRKLQMTNANADEKSIVEASVYCRTTPFFLAPMLNKCFPTFLKPLALSQKNDHLNRMDCGQCECVLAIFGQCPWHHVNELQIYSHWLKSRSFSDRYIFMH